MIPRAMVSVDNNIYFYSPAYFNDIRHICIK